MDDFDDGSTSDINHFKPVFEVVSTVPSDYYSHTMNPEQTLPRDYLDNKRHYTKGTINQKDIHNTSISILRGRQS